MVSIQDSRSDDMDGIPILPCESVPSGVFSNEGIPDKDDFSAMSPLLRAKSTSSWCTAGDDTFSTSKSAKI